MPHSSAALQCPSRDQKPSGDDWTLAVPAPDKIAVCARSRADLAMHASAHGLETLAVTVWSRPGPSGNWCAPGNDARSGRDSGSS
jgi:hypothetical protein